MPEPATMNPQPSHPDIERRPEPQTVSNWLIGVGTTLLLAFGGTIYVSTANAAREGEARVLARIADFEVRQQRIEARAGALESDAAVSKAFRDEMRSGLADIKAGQLAANTELRELSARMQRTGR